MRGARLFRTTRSSWASRSRLHANAADFRCRALFNHEAVLIEWTDSNISNAIFEGTRPRIAARAAQHAAFIRWAT